MRLLTLELPEEVREERLAVYRENAIRRKDRGVLKALEAVEAGCKVIDIGEAFKRSAGMGLPKVGIARCDHTRVRGRRWESGRLWLRSYRPGVSSWEFKLPPGVLDRSRGNGASLTAKVPYLPPDVRPVNPKERFVLWEAAWRTSFQPTDPAILEHVAGNLYIVESVWDLTEVEAGALA